MTKLADAIRRSQRIEAAPMGFGAARAAARPTMVVGGLAAANEDLKTYKDAGADVVVIDARAGVPSEADLKKLTTAADGVVIGLLAAKIDAGQAAAAAAAGVDFLIFDAETTPAAALLDEQTGYVLALPGQPDEAYLRTLEALSLDGVYLDSLPSPLTVARQLDLGRISLFARKPLVCHVQEAISPEDLRCLRAAGGAVVLAAGSAAVKSLKETVAALPPRKARREEGRVVSLPRGAMAPDEEEND